MRLYDLSDTLSNATSGFEPNPHEIEYISSEESAAAGRLNATADLWPDGLGPQVERVRLATHSGTHVDAPYHYGPAKTGTARTIDVVPLEWFVGPGVVFDMRHKQAGEGISRDDLVAELDRLHHRLAPGEIALIMTGASANFRHAGYENTHAGLRRGATEFLIDHGVRLIGIDAWGLDRPFDVMLKDAKAGRAQLWESHVLGREKEYCQIERLVDLDRLPSPTGFMVYAFPVKIERASAGWARVVAIYADQCDIMTPNAATEAPSAAH